MKISLIIEKVMGRPTSSKVFCRGRIVTGPDYMASIGTMVLFTVPWIVFVSHPAIQLIQLEGGVVGLVLAWFMGPLCLYSWFQCSFNDPGIIPRGSPIKAEDKPPRSQQVIVNGQPALLKYCPTCNIYRPPRSSHCSICDNCVELLDHHCPWLGNCIGRRNYFYFTLFVWSICALCILVIVSASFLVALKGVRHQIPALLIGVYSFIALWFVFGLCGFHIGLVVSGKTTNEQLKHFFPTQSPFSRGALRNFVALLCVSDKGERKSTLGDLEMKV